MSALNRRAAAAAVIGAVAGVVPVSAASAATNRIAVAPATQLSDGQPDPGAAASEEPAPPAGSTGSTSPAPASGDQANPPCSHVTFPDPMPPVITCGPVTINITFTTVTTTTTTVSAPIVTAPITTAVTNRAPARTALRCRPVRRPTNRRTKQQRSVLVCVPSGRARAGDAQTSSRG
jgi:hypothetical protein